jgi:hypothetical protein
MSLHDQSMASILSSTSGKSQMTTEMCLDPRTEFDLFEFQSREPSQEIIVCCKEVFPPFAPSFPLCSLSHAPVLRSNRFFGSRRRVRSST